MAGGADWFFDFASPEARLGSARMAEAEAEARLDAAGAPYSFAPTLFVCADLRDPEHAAC